MARDDSLTFVYTRSSEERISRKAAGSMPCRVAFTHRAKVFHQLDHGRVVDLDLVHVYSRQRKPSAVDDVGERLRVYENVSRG